MLYHEESQVADDAPKNIFIALLRFYEVILAALNYVA
jgi:hypothetical protein